jgi:hypothetical protein
MSVALSASRPRRFAERASAADGTAVLVGLLTLGVFVLRLTQMNQSLYGDEIWSYQDVTGHGLGSLIRGIHTGGENSPPLFFVLAWISSKLGDPTVSIRLPSLVLGTATIPLIYVLGRDTVGRPAGVIGAAIVGTAPFSIYYGIEARPYATMVFFVTLSTLALVHAVRSDSRAWWAVYAVAAAGAAYSHYTAIFVLIVQWVWSLWAARNRIREPVIAGAVAVVLYLPWVGHVRGKLLGVIALFEPLNASNVLTDLPRPIGGYPYAALHAIPTIPGLVTICVCAALGLAALVRFRLRKHPSRRRLIDGDDGLAILILALALATPVGLLAYSIIGTDLWTARNLYASVPAAALVLGGLLAALPSPARWAAVGLVLAILVAGTIRAISPRYARPAYRAAAEYIDRVARPTDPVLVYPSLLGLDAAIPAQLRKPHRVWLNRIPRAWPATHPGDNAYVVVDDATAKVLKLSIPHPPGFVLTGRHHYGGMMSFTLFFYRALPRTAR